MQVEEFGDAVVYCGDCREIVPELGAVEAVITDPPYGIGWAANPHQSMREAGVKASDWDNRPVSGLETLISKGRIQVVWGGNYYPLPPSRGWLVWRKTAAPPSMADCELAWTNQDMNARLFSYGHAANIDGRYGHPTQKPEALMRWTIEIMPRARTIMDPFMGSGTTGVAALQLGRHFIGVDTEQAYFDMACRRLEAAERLSGLHTGVFDRPEPWSLASVPRLLAPPRGPTTGAPQSPLASGRQLMLLPLARRRR